MLDGSAERALLGSLLCFTAGPDWLSLGAPHSARMDRGDLAGTLGKRNESLAPSCLAHIYPAQCSLHYSGILHSHGGTATCAFSLSQSTAIFHLERLPWASGQT